VPDYDFRVLSPIDFELLAQALLQKELRLRLEGFKSGADQGVDLRYARNVRHDLVVQCKHYAGSNFAALRRSVIREVPKLRQLAPSRYMVVTSLPLSFSNKEKLRQICAPFISRTADIFGREDLNNLLARHKSVERQTFKLWFSSVNIFEEILEKKVKHVSRDALEAIQEKAKYFVQNPSFEKALRILNKRNVCIIAGIPGIGKTTLAEMLLLHYVELGYELVKIESDISEARALDHATVRRVFYYDDFLGQASLSEKLNKNEDQKLLDFLGAIRRSSVSKMILTTREYILNQTKLRYEKMDRARFDIETCVVDLQQYTRLIRAQILFNHLYFSQISSTYKKAIVRDERYLTIVDHENYSPRIIQLMTDPTWLAKVKPGKYVSAFLTNLDDPHEIWRHAFEQQLTDGARVLLCMLATLPRQTYLDDVRPAFRFLHATYAAKYQCDTRPNDLRRVLKELDGNFVQFDREDGRTTVAFHNPSIRDFIQNYLLQNEEEVVLLLHGTKFFEQLMWLWRFEREGSRKFTFRAMLRKNLDTFIESLARTVDLQSYKERYRWVEGEFRYDPVSIEERVEFITTVAETVTHPNLHALILGKLDRIKRRVSRGRVNRRDLARLLQGLRKLPAALSNEVEPLIFAAKSLFLRLSDDIRDFEAYRMFARTFPELLEEETRSHVADRLEALAARRNFEYYDPDEIREYASKLRDFGREFSVNVAHRVMSLEAYAQRAEKAARRRSRTRRSVRRSRLRQHECSNEDLASMFAALR
jgi:hypothetical protein